MTAPWEILNVRIVDDLTGDELADVDAASTAEALAYWLRSRHVDPTATEERVLVEAGIDQRPDGWRSTPILREERNPISGALVAAVFAETH